MDSSPSYLIILNIPKNFHSSDLRSFFSDSIENQDYFMCFHFRHRPQTEIVLSLQLPIYKKVSYSHDSGNKNIARDTHHTLLLEKDSVCCIAKCSSRKATSDIIKKYNLQNWVDRNDTFFSTCCVMVPISEVSHSISLPLTSFCLNNSTKDLELPQSKIEGMFELKPPLMMPKGNVGTPTKYFLKMINTCRLPSKLITKLGLNFPKIKNRRYGSVPFNYSTQSEEETKSSHEPRKSSLNDNSNNMTNQRVKSSSQSEPEDNTKKQEEEEEEWDRHEALHDDVTEQERNKERLYEEEMEVVWEKGGPGIVWYTDAQVWKEAEGDFDEQTTDDWDVDYSVYFEDDGGDKDARDMVEMRRSTMWRQGQMETVFKKPSKQPVRPKRTNDSNSLVSKSKIVGPFEKHTRGIGRRLMERQGWKDGSGLGRSQKGISIPIESEGQKPKERKGLGYFGEKIPHFNKNRKSREGVVIATINDRPEDTDPAETLLRRNPPTSMKYRYV